MRLIFNIFLLFFIFVAASSQASQSDNRLLMPDIIQQKWTNLSPIGMAAYSKFGFQLYDAELWSSSKQVNDINNQHYYALSLKYKRNIKKNALLNATQKQWQRLDVAPSSSNEWIAQLANIWPDVKKGYILSCIVTSTGETKFYLNDQYIGEISDANFGPAFLNIWLNPKSVFKKQRQQLLGML